MEEQYYSIQAIGKQYKGSPINDSMNHRNDTTNECRPTVLQAHQDLQERRDGKR